jgi:TolB-like protein/Flp pilus assembly protein TadD/predicted Ser/Thr protein kinase
MKCPKCLADNPETSHFCAECGASLHALERSPILATKTLQTPLEELTSGSIFAGRYQIIEELGKGGMGHVYRALDKKLSEEVAIKLIRPEIAADKGTLGRFQNELKLARRISHRNVGRMYELMEEKGHHFISMEYVPGEDLRSFIRRSGQLTVSKAISISKQICEGLAEAHRQGVIHRDLKPSNIIIDREGNARIMDFGIARSVKAKGITGTGVMIGTPEYMSPEQVEGKEADQRSDIYSFGIIIFEMLTGHVPFEGDTPLAVAVKQKTEPAPDPKRWNSQISDDLSLFIHRCLEKSAERRYPNTEEMLAELNRMERDIPAETRVVPKTKPATTGERTVTLPVRKIWVYSLGLVVLMVIAFAVWHFVFKKAPPPSNETGHSLAILPFEDLSLSKNQEYLCNGIAETLINALSGIKDLHVPARTSAFSFKDKNLDIREIGQRLNVKMVLEGSIQVVGPKLRITARLSNTEDGYQLWSESYDRALDDVFVIQDDITERILKTLQVKFLGQAEASPLKRYTENREAYELYLQGLYLWNKRGKANLERAAAFFEEATRKDPNYALAYVGLANSYAILANNYLLPAAEAVPKAKVAAAKAFEIDPNSAEVLASLGFIKFNFDWDFSGAEKDFRRAIEIKPGYASAHQWSAFLLVRMGRFEESLAEIKKARDFDPLSSRIQANVGYMYYYRRQYDQAIAELEKAQELNPNDSWIYQYRGYIYVEMNLFAEARESFNRFNELAFGKAFEDEKIAFVYARWGKKQDAYELLRKLEAEGNPQKEPLSPGMMAAAYGALGEKDKAFSWLEKAYEEGDLILGYLKVRPMFDPLRADPRFAELTKKVGLEK